MNIGLLAMGSAKANARILQRTAFVGVSMIVIGCTGSGSGTATLGGGSGNCNAEIQAFRSLKPSDSAADTVARRSAMITCVNRWDSVAKETAARAAGAEGMDLARMFFDIPEYHDEGRLPAGRDASTTLLGPRAAIFASPFLGGFTRPSQIFEQGLPGTLAAMVFVQPDEGESIPQTYQNLKLQSGLNCIWLFAKTPKTKDYRAFVSYPVDSICAYDKVDTHVELEVIAVHDPRFGADADYPAVARFDTDLTGSQPVLGFKCLDAFCEVGPAHFRPKPSAPTVTSGGMVTSAVTSGAAATSANLRVRAIKGWYDEQLLAYQDDNFVWRQSTIHAVLAPNPAASQLDSGDFYKRWQRVATITLDADPPAPPSPAVQNPPRDTKYYKWGLRKGDNQVWLQQSIEKKWKVKIVTAAGDSTVWVNTIRNVHHSVAVPATARFRWTGIDDGIWVPCGNACCQSDGT